MNLLFYLALARLPLGPAVAIEFVGPLARGADRVPPPLGFPVDRRGGGGSDAAPAARHRGRAGSGRHPARPRRGHWPGRSTSCSGSARAGSTAARRCRWGCSLPRSSWRPSAWRRPGSGLLAPAILIAGLAVALMSSALPYSLEMVALRRLDRKRFGVLMSLEPAVAACAGLVLLGEQISARAVARDRPGDRGLRGNHRRLAAGGARGRGPGGRDVHYLPARTREATLMYLRPAS